ncbi:MAG: hypothetical protein HDR26_09810 [Lachnospiraceae bacterium]|nr:hypothetical protein [Lachnospiraceae bacterium]
MKFVKGISLYFFYPLTLFCLGLYTGVKLQHFFYPGQTVRVQEQPEFSSPALEEPNTTEPEQPELPSVAGEDAQEPVVPPAMETVKKEDVLTADTDYVLREVDVRKGTSVETVWGVPERYMGMNRETFIAAMENYAASPPLQELERGFTGVEVVSFSASRVVVEVHYAYVEPSEGFYLGVNRNYIVVYLDDMETVYLNTDILLEALPERIQQQIMGYMYIEDEEALYHFLESYSS